MLQHVEVAGTHPDLTPERFIKILHEPDENMQWTDTVLSLELEPQPDGSRISRWETKFRDGIMRWSQRDEFDDATHTMSFELIEGDVETMSGYWHAEATEEGCRIRFAADFDLGVPSMQNIIDPIAVRVLRESISTQLKEVFGEGVVLLEDGTPTDARLLRGRRASTAFRLGKVLAGRRRRRRGWRRSSRPAAR
jgi:Polyketide cyclase / dehydrase and lipid transport